ncbi:MAG TPA: protein kinase [Kofleriaceae bacterium]|nr:protein kinase [Kofleriaceae bacterium]
MIDGRYAVEAVLGRGGMGVVLRARHKFTGALVAVKMLHPDLTRDAQIEGRFLAEARASNAIDHPAIVKVLDAGRTPESELYLVMELLVGQPMRSAVSRRLGQPAIKRVTLELLDALGAAHARGFVHRDLKPENVFLADPDGTVKLLDFGIAKVLDATKTATLGTQAGVVLGTVAYMAPEQLHDAASVDARADLWALGVMIYEMLAGRLPYRGTTVEEIFVRLAREEPDPIRAWIPTIATTTEQFMQRALARDPNARFRSAAEMATAFVTLPLDQPHVNVAIRPRGPTDSSPMATQATGFGATAAPSTPGLPPTVTPAPLPIARPTPTPAPMPVPARDGPNRAAILGVALGIAAAAVIAAAIFVAKRHKPTEPHGITTDLVMGSSTPPPAAAPPPPVDAAAPIAMDAAIEQPPPQQPHTVPHQHAQQPPQPPQPAQQPQPQQPQQPYPEQAQPPAQAPSSCTQSCELAARCGLAANAQCLTACYQDPTINQCSTTSTGNCNEYSRCMLETACHAHIFNGNGTCNAALSCQERQCTLGNMICGCACATGMSPSHALQLFHADACYLACNGNTACNKGCGPVVQACKAQ